MYGYKTKHAILQAYVKWQFEQKPVDLLNKMSFNLLYINANIILKGKFKNLDFVRVSLVNMELEGYFEFSDPRDSNDKVTGLLVHITKKGYSAFTGRLFLEKQSEIFWKRFIEILLTSCNAILDFGVIYSIIVTNTELSKLKEELKSVKEMMQSKQVVTNPNSGHLQHFLQTNPLDSLKNSNTLK